MRNHRRAVVASLLPAIAALSWPIAGNSAVVAETTEATCTADGTALTIVAEDNKFDKDCMAVPSDQGFTIELDNQDWAIPHNVSIYDSANDNTALYKGEVIYGPKKITYSVPAQATGTYEFICDPHAEFMRGTFIVE